MKATLIFRMVDFMNQDANTMENIETTYTPLRQFYAWVGFSSLVTYALIAIFAIAQWVVWANEYITINN